MGIETNLRRLKIDEVPENAKLIGVRLAGLYVGEGRDISELSVERSVERSGLRDIENGANAYVLGDFMRVPDGRSEYALGNDRVTYSVTFLKI